MKVQNMTSARGNTVPNQFVITDDKGEYFQSYNSLIVFRPYDGPTQLDHDTWDYSVTTSKYRNQFLGCNTADVKARIASGEYVLTDLN